jgi:hypothetical protein
VVDGDATRYCQSLVWLGTLIHRAGVDRADIHVHLTDSRDGLFEDTYKAIGVNTWRVRPFPTPHGHCNKIRQFDTPALGGYARVILCDCDVAFDRNIALDFPGVLIGAKVVDLPNPPLPVLEAVLEASGIPCAPPRVPTSFVQRGTRCELNTGHESGAMTLQNNCNGGLYIVDRTLWPILGRKWAQWADWLASCADRLEA